jgi:hypothetical protein
MRVGTAATTTTVVMITATIFSVRNVTIVVITLITSLCSP